MSAKSFQARYAAVLALALLFDGPRVWSGSRARRGMMNAPPGGGFGSGMLAMGGSSGSNPNQVTPTGGIGSHLNLATTGLGVKGVPVPTPPGSVYFFSQIETAGSEAAINLPRLMSLADVCVECDDGPGTFEVTYLPSNNAHFTGESSATDPTGLKGVGSSALHYPVSWTNGTTIPAATFVANGVGDLLQTTLTFTTQSLVGINPDISAYRAMTLFENFSDTTPDAQSVTFDNGPAVPIAFLHLIHALATITSTPTGTIDYTNSGSYKHIIPAQGNQVALQIVPAQPITPALTFAFNQTNTATGGSSNVLLLAVIFY